jgi:hypothetical protein
MSNKIICTLLLILFIILLIFIINKKNIEKFSSEEESNSNDESRPKSNKWTTNKDELEREKEKLNNVQYNQVKNMITSISKSTLQDLITIQSPLLKGPAGPIGIQGPAGTTLIASGRLINKNGSFDDSGTINYFSPKYVVTRTEGTNPTSSLAYMDNNSAFASFQSWQLDVNNNLINRYDGNCLTMNKTKDGLYIDKCSDNLGQKWDWDRSNRIISKSEKNGNSLKCIGLTKPEQNVLTTNVPGCSGTNCISNQARRYLTVKDCDINNINEDEIWSFV